MLKLFYITKDPAVARIAQAAGVDRIFVDMEYIGKAQRQGGMDTVQNHHTVEDVSRLRPVLDQAELLVRVNPVHPGSKDEIDRVIAAGADVIMLPMWQSVEEVQQFIRWVDGRAKTLLLLENQAAVDCLDRVVALPGVDEIHIGLNDLSISQGKNFCSSLWRTVRWTRCAPRSKRRVSLSVSADSVVWAAAHCRQRIL